MPLGKSPILQNDLMAEGDNQKFLLFNDALVAIEDAVNRALPIDMSSSSRDLTESEALRYGVYVCSGHTAVRSLSIPSTVGGGTSPTNRKIAVRNDGSAALTVTHNAVGGNELVVGAGTTALIYADGTDIISLGGVNNSATIPLSDEGIEVIGGLLSVNFSGSGYTITDDGNGAATITMDVPQAAADLNDVPAYAASGGKALVVKVDETGLEFVSVPTDGATIKSLYEGEADTNGYTDAEKTKLAGLEDSAFKGTYATGTALETAHPAPAAGSYAYVDAGVGSDTQLYIWDADDGQWISTGGAGSTETSASIKTKYESNANTNAFTDSEQSKLFDVESGATADQTAAEIESLLDAYYGNTDWRTGGSGGGSSISVDGVSVLATPTDLNFTGDVTVTDDGDGTATINVTGGTGGTPSAVDIESALDTYYGTPDWRNTLPPPAAFGAHTYWRLLRVSSLGSTYTGLAELKFNGATPSGGAVFGNDEFGSFDKISYAVDGDPSSGWGTDQMDGAFIGYQFSSAIEVDSVSIQARDSSNGAAMTFTEFVVQYSDDGVTYTDAWTVTTDAWGISEERTFGSPVGQLGISRVDPAATEAALDAYYGNTDWRTGGSGGVSISEETANYTIIDADLSGNVFKKINVAAANTVTVPAGLTGNEPVTFLQSGAGQTAIVADTGVTINSADGNLKTRVQFSSATLIPDGTDTYYLVGDLAA